MAKFELKANVIVPNEVDVEFVRADHAEVVNIYRTFFEVFLSVFSTLLGYILALPQVQLIHWIFLIVVGVAMVAFAVIGYRFRPQKAAR